MRLVPSLNFSYPYLKSVSIAAGAAAAAGLLVLGACSDSVTSKIAAPKDLTPRFGIVGDQAHIVQVCVDPGSSAGTYKFVVARMDSTKWPYPMYESQNSDDLPHGAAFHLTGDGPFRSSVDNDVITSPVFLTKGASVVCADVFVRATTTVPVANGGNRLWSQSGRTVNPPGSVNIHPEIPAGFSYTVSCHNDDLGNPQDTATIQANATATTGLPPVCTNTSSIGTIINMHSSANVFHGSTLTYTFTAPTITSCILGYPSDTPPFNSVNRGRVVFNESSVLDRVTTSGDELRLWAVDEHATTLGVNKVSVKAGSPAFTTITNYPLFTPQVGAIGAQPNPNVGTTDLSGDQRGTDGFDRPLWPSLFITDITADPNSKAGDWQYGAPNGATPPNAIYGTWKAAAVFIDKTKNPPTRTVTPGADPTKNHLNVGVPAVPGPAAVPAGVQDLGYTAEVVWNLSALTVGGNPLIAGHSYRLQFMVHDGDQNKTGGDVGQACVTLNN